MKKLALLALALTACGLGAFGCNNKADSAAPPTPTNVTVPGGDKMAGGDKSGGGDKMAAADPVKDKVSAAISADDKLKGAGITVEHKDGKVLLKGEVADTATKKHADEVVKKAITDAGSSDKLQNMLTAKSH